MWFLVILEAKGFGKADECMIALEENNKQPERNGSMMKVHFQDKGQRTRG